MFFSVPHPSHYVSDRASWLRPLSTYPLSYREGEQRTKLLLRRHSRDTIAKYTNDSEWRTESSCGQHEVERPGDMFARLPINRTTLLHSRTLLATAGRIGQYKI